MRKIAPCKNCSDRYDYCHARCEKYIAWSKELTEQREQIKRLKDREKLLNTKSPKARRRKR